MNNCNRCYYNDAKENICTHGSPIFIDDVCTDYQDSEFVMQIRADAIAEISREMRMLYGNGYEKRIRADAIEEFLDKAKELYPNDSNALYKVMCIAGQLKEQK